VSDVPPAVQQDDQFFAVLGHLVGKLAEDRIPVIDGITVRPPEDQLKAFAAAAASSGRVALFHMVGITPEARRLADVVDDAAAGGTRPRAYEVGEAEIREFQAGYAKGLDSVDLVVFSAPQLSLVEMQRLAELLDGRRATIPLLAVTSPQVKGDADRMGLTARIETAGGTVLSGMCFYQSYAREMAEANGWKRLATNSAKLVNIIGGYGYKPVLLSMEACVKAACTNGRIAP
jgi:predicted aconitase